MKSINCTPRSKKRVCRFVPLRLYLKNGKIKCEIAVARGKKMHDKRESERAREAQEEARQAVRRSKSGWE